MKPYRCNLRSVDHTVLLLGDVSADTLKLYLRLSKDRIFDPDELVTDALKNWRDQFEESTIVTCDYEDGSMKEWTPDTFICKQFEEKP